MSKPSKSALKRMKRAAKNAAVAEEPALERPADEAFERDLAAALAASLAIEEPPAPPEEPPPEETTPPEEPPQASQPAVKKPFFCRWSDKDCVFKKGGHAHSSTAKMGFAIPLAPATARCTPSPARSTTVLRKGASFFTRVPINPRSPTAWNAPSASRTALSPTHFCAATSSASRALPLWSTARCAGRPRKAS